MRSTSPTWRTCSGSRTCATRSCSPWHHHGLPGRGQHPLPGHRLQRRPVPGRGREQGGVVSFLNLFSGGALTKFAVFGLGIMPYITSSIIIQLLMVVIPKFEQWREEGRRARRS
jgi:hypothetical protein